MKDFLGIVELFEKKVVLPAMLNLSTKKPNVSSGYFSLFPVESRLQCMIVSLLETMPRGTSIDEVTNRRFDSSSKFYIDVKSTTSVHEWLLEALSTIRKSATPSCPISFNITYYAFLIPLIASNPVDPKARNSEKDVEDISSVSGIDSQVINMTSDNYKDDSSGANIGKLRSAYKKILEDVVTALKSAFNGDASNTSPFPSYSSVQQFISPPLSSLNCRFICLLFANLEVDDMVAILGEFVTVARSCADASKVRQVLYTTFVGRYFTLLSTLLDLCTFPEFKSKMIARHNTASEISSSSRSSLTVYSPTTFKHIDQNAHDPCSPIYENNYMPKQSNFLFHIDGEEDFETINDYGVPNSAAKHLIEEMTAAVASWMDFGSRSAKYDNGYLYHSVWKADSSLLALRKGSEPCMIPDGPPPDRASNEFLLYCKTLLVSFADKTTLLSESQTLSLMPSDRKEIESTFSAHLRALEACRFDAIVPCAASKTLPAILSSLQAKAAVMMQLVSSQLHSPHFNLNNTKRSRISTLPPDEIDSDVEDDYDCDQGDDRDENEESNLDWFYDVTGCVNQTQATENSVSPFHPDDISADLEDGDSIQLVASFPVALELAVSALDVTLDDLNYSVNSFEAIFSNLLDSLCKQSNSKRSVANLLLTRDFGYEPPPPAWCDISVSSNINANVKSLFEDPERRRRILTCAQITDSGTINKIQALTSPIFDKKNNCEDDSFKRCRARYGLEAGRFVNGRIFGMKHTRKAARGEKVRSVSLSQKCAM